MEGQLDSTGLGVMFALKHTTNIISLDSVLCFEDYGINNKLENIIDNVDESCLIYSILFCILALWKGMPCFLDYKLLHSDIKCTRRIFITTYYKLPYC